MRQSKEEVEQRRGSWEEGKPGRPPRFDWDIALEICRRMALGETLRSICKHTEGMPAASTVRQWHLDDREGFSVYYARAREAGLDAMADEIMDISDDGSNDYMERNDPGNKGYAVKGEHIQRSRLRVDSRKWYLSKMAPKRFGERSQIDHSSTDGTMTPKPTEITIVGLSGDDDPEEEPA